MKLKIGTLVDKKYKNRFNRKTCYNSLTGKNTPLSYGEAAFNIILKSYIKWADKRNLKWDLSIECFKYLINNNCFYCGIGPQNKKIIKGLNGSYTYNGIDQKDNLLGYIEINCVTCCKTCNFMKKNSLYEEFLIKVNQIAKKHPR